MRAGKAIGNPGTRDEGSLAYGNRHDQRAMEPSHSTGKGKFSRFRASSKWSSL